MEKLGIDPIQLLAQVINFLILFFVLYKMTYKTIFKILGDRQKKIAESIELSEKIKKEWEDLEGQKRKEVEKAKNEADAILKKAEEAADEEKKKILTQAREEAEKLVKKELKSFEEKRKADESQFKKRTAEISTLIANRLIKDFLKKEDQKALIDQAIGELKEVKI